MRPLDDEWRKSTRSSGNEGCVEARFIGDAVEVRDTKNREGGTLRFAPAEWAAFATGIREGEFGL